MITPGRGASKKPHIAASGRIAGSTVGAWHQCRKGRRRTFSSGASGDAGCDMTVASAADENGRNGPMCLVCRRSPLGSIAVGMCHARFIRSGIEPLVGSLGDSHDNALSETINGLFKAQVIHRRGPRCSVKAAE